MFVAIFAEFRTEKTLKYLSVLADNFEESMNTKMIRYVQYGLIGLCFLACLMVSPAYAGSSTDEDTYLLFSGYRCEVLIKLGSFSKTVTGKATEFSCQKPAIGIALYAGKDLGKHSPEKIAQYFKDELAKHNVKAEVFIKHNHEYGSSMTFYINGDSWLKKAVGALEAVDMIEGLAAEAKLVYFTNGQIKE